MNSSPQPWTVIVGVAAGFVHYTVPESRMNRLALAVALGAMGLFWVRYVRKALNRRREVTDNCRMCGKQKSDLSLAADGMLLCESCMAQWKQRQADVELARHQSEMWTPVYPSVYVPSERSTPGACCDDGWGVVAATAK